jgi:hypothetical protein
MWLTNLAFLCLPLSPKRLSPEVPIKIKILANKLGKVLSMPANGPAVLLPHEPVKRIVALQWQCRRWVISGQTITGENLSLSAIARKRTFGGG